MSYTIDLYDANPAQADVIGNKAAGLVQLHRLGFRVPRAVCVLTSAHRAWRRDGSMSASLMTQILTAFRTLRGPVAVRSSSPAEDREEASFAGQYLTVLGVRTEEQLLAAVERCWRSASSEEAVVYRRDRGAEAEVEMAVLIQELVPVTTAGVLFTLNPVTERVDQIVINATFGLGEALVSGRTEPDTFVLDKLTGRTVESRLGTKRLATDITADGVAEVPLDAARREEFCLNDAQLHQLLDAARKLEAHYDYPMDCEWAFVNDTLHMLQARPVTTGIAAYLTYALDQWARDRGLEDDPQEVWARGSVLSGLAVSPLYYSEMSAFFADMFPEIARQHGAPPIKRKIFRYHNGFTYTDSAFSSAADPPGAVKAEGPLSPGWKSNLRIALRHPRSLAFWCNIDYYYRRWNQDWSPDIEARRPDLATADPKEIRHFIEFIEKQRRQRSVVAGLAVGYATNFLGLVVYLLNRWVPDASEDTVGTLTSGLEDSLSHRENVELWQLAQAAKNSPRVRAAIEAKRYADVATSAVDEAFLGSLDAFRRRHAHRGNSDRDIFQPRWGDGREPLLRQIGVMLALGPEADPSLAHARAEHKRRQRETEILARLGRGPVGAIRRRLFMRVLRASQRYVMHRDNQRHTFEPYFLELRRAYIAIGASLAQQGILDQAEDIFFLGKNEIYAYLDGALPDTTLHRRATWRRTWWSKVSREEPAGYLQGNQPYNPDSDATSGVAHLTGSGGAPGIATGPVRLVASLAEMDKVRRGDIIVTYAIDPAWTPVFGIIGGVISVEGGMLAHAAVLGREYGLPVVLGVRGATTQLRDDDVVSINGTTGAISLISSAEQSPADPVRTSAT
jgi:phosphohistidine swiveling domain-containing protein